MSILINRNPQSVIWNGMSNSSEILENTRVEVKRKNERVFPLSQYFLSQVKITRRMKPVQ